MKLELTQCRRVFHLALAAGLLHAGMASAGVLAEDQFENYAPGALEGGNGGMGWSAAWSGPTSSAIAEVVNASANPLSFTPADGVAITGGNRAVEVYSNPRVNTVASSRRFSVALPPVVYAGYLVRLQAGSWGGNNTFSIHLSNAAGNTSSLNFGLRSSTPNEFIVRNGTGAPVTGASTDGAVQSGRDYYLVARFSKLTSSGTTSSTYDRIELWVNPAAADLTATPNGDARLQLSAGAGLSSLSHVLVRQAALDSNDRIWFDHLVVGTEWSDVVPSGPVNQPPTVVLNNPADGLVLTEPANLELAAIAVDADGTVTNVEFFANGTKLGEDRTSPYRLTWSGISAGAYVVTARATDNLGASRTSAAANVSVLSVNTNGVVSGELKKWHRVTITFDGPATRETATPNPFRDYRLQVTFSHPASGKTYQVPGFYAADGNAAETSATSGNKWRVRFAPDETGEWLYVASFRSGTDVALSDDPNAGLATAFNGTGGRFVIAPSDKTGRDLRAHGRLDYVGRHHLRFAETGEYFLKCGADAPENLLNYADFDEVPNVGNRQKTWSFHARDYDPADAAPYTWKQGRGANLLGAIRYLSDKGMNAFSFLTFNVDGDDDNVFPHRINGTVADFEGGSNNKRWANQNVFHDRFDVSRLAQWERIFSYGDKKGMYLHFKTMETENELWMDGGDLGPERRLYYRELIARFAHHLALNWNLGEEINNATTAQKQAWAQYFWDHDPYRHNIVIHNGANHYDLLGNASRLTGFSLQTSKSDFSQVHSRTLNYLQRSDAAGKPWVVACDEPGDASLALVPDSDIGVYDPGRRHARQNGLWGNLMAGGAGLEWYFGYQRANSDLTCQDWRSRDLFWDQCRYALQFFQSNAIPFWEMHNDDALTSAADGYCLVKPNAVYVVFLKSAATTTLNLGAASGIFSIHWYDPRNGGALVPGAVRQVTGGNVASIGAPPAGSADDWVALVRRLPPASPRLNWIRNGNDLRLEWTAVDFQLQHAPQTMGPWTAVVPEATSPWQVPSQLGEGYYRLRWTNN